MSDPLPAVDRDPAAQETPELAAADQDHTAQASTKPSDTEPCDTKPYNADHMLEEERRLIERCSQLVARQHEAADEVAAAKATLQKLQAALEDKEAVAKENGIDHNILFRGYLDVSSAVGNVHLQRSISLSKVVEYMQAKQELESTRSNIIIGAKQHLLDVLFAVDKKKKALIKDLHDHVNKQSAEIDEGRARIDKLTTMVDLCLEKFTMIDEKCGEIIPRLVEKQKVIHEIKVALAALRSSSAASTCDAIDTIISLVDSIYIPPPAED